MTPAELITQKLYARLNACGVTLPIDSLLLDALAGEKRSVEASNIGINVHISNQLAEPLPQYQFSATIILTVAVDDDKGGSLFGDNYAAIWNAIDFLARGDNCTELGDEGEGNPVFCVDGFSIDSGDDPDYQEDENGGSWTTSFKATITGRAT